MANRTYLLSTTRRTADIYRLYADLQTPGSDFAEIATASYRLPIPWLCCFRPDDLELVKIPWESDDGTEAHFEMHIPCAPLARAIANLEASRDIFGAIAGDAGLGHEYWSDALASLQQAPLPFLTIHLIEHMYLNDRVDVADAVRGAVAGSVDAIVHLKRLSGFEDGHIPYSIEKLRAAPVQDDDEMRANNAAALDGGFEEPDRYFWHRLRTSA